MARLRGQQLTQEQVRMQERQAQRLLELEGVKQASARQMIGARLTAGVALASIKLWLPFVREAGSHRNLRSRFISRT